MKIKVLGSGSSGNCYRVSDGKTSLLLDAGLPIRKIKELLNFNLHSVDGVLITHEHIDHAKAIKGLSKYGINCYMTKGTAEVLGVSNHRIKTINCKVGFTIGTFHVVAFDVIHDAADPVGFLIKSSITGEKLLYMTDTQYCKYCFRNLNYIMMEINFDYEILKNNVINHENNDKLAHRIYKSHMSLDAAIDFINANKSDSLKELYLLHLSDANSDEEKFKKEMQKITGVPVYIA